MANDIIVTTSDGTAKIQFDEKVTKMDFDISTQMDDIINQLYAKNVFRVEIDLSHISFITSLMLGKLVSYHKDLQSRDGEVSIVNASQQIYDVFHTTALTQILNIQKA